MISTADRGLNSWGFKCDGESGFLGLFEFSSKEVNELNERKIPPKKHPEAPTINKSWEISIFPR